MKKRVLLGLLLLTIAGLVFAQGQNAITGKWYVRIENDRAEIYDFRLNGTLLVAGESQGIRFTVSGNTITTTYSGVIMGTGTFTVSGTVRSAVLTISNANESSGLVNGTYYR